MSCSSKNCCKSDLPGATLIERAGSASSEHRASRPLSCAQCGNDENAIVRALKTGIELGKRQGAQEVAEETYKVNIDAATLRDELDKQWHAHVRRYGE